ncbi:MAG TPA: phosphoglycerate kinase [Oligoflexia bacterium]|nr:phosphoglycerate kinase [Oligoflexia bacterium]HMR25252.1 phosphoglycerate kinase [Oligoflexia bacterium]
MISLYQDHITCLEDIDLAGKRVLCRMDYNVPLDEKGNITDDTRIQASLPTLNYLLEQGAYVTLISHLGRPKGKFTKAYSLLPVASYLCDVLDREVILADDCVGDAVKKILHTRDQQQLLMLENLRFHTQENDNDTIFAQGLKANHDVFVNDAFGVCHRADASVDALPRLFKDSQKCIGKLIEQEIKALEPLLKDAPKPFALIMGGAKVSDKIKVLESLLKKVDYLFLGGAMVFTFLKAEGKSVGLSRFEADKVDYAKKLLQMARDRKVRVCFPKDYQVASSMDAIDQAYVTKNDRIDDDVMALDIGPKTLDYFSGQLQDCQTVFWNGPMGWFEQEPFDAGSIGLAKELANLDANCIIGGGDSAAAVVKSGYAQKMAHISTGGGATLSFLEGKRLPGLSSMVVKK